MGQGSLLVLCGWDLSARVAVSLNFSLFSVVSEVRCRVEGAPERWLTTSGRSVEDKVGEDV